MTGDDSTKKEKLKEREEKKVEHLAANSNQAKHAERTDGQLKSSINILIIIDEERSVS